MSNTNTYRILFDIQEEVHRFAIKYHRSLQNQKLQNSVLDEIQKVPHWSAVVKALYDADRRNNMPVRIILSGSSSLLLHKGLEDSLMGRFEMIHSPHWSYTECSQAFGFSLDDYLYYGGYPGAARFAGDDIRWVSYVRDAIVEPTILQDVLALEDILRNGRLNNCVAHIRSPTYIITRKSSCPRITAVIQIVVKGESILLPQPPE